MTSSTTSIQLNSHHNINISNIINTEEQQNNKDNCNNCSINGISSTDINSTKASAILPDMQNSCHPSKPDDHQIKFKESCFKNCQTFIGPSFCRNFKNFSVQPLAGGLTNEIFIVSSSESETGAKSYIYRIFGSGKTNNISEENTIIAMLSIKHLAPKFYGAFEGGRIEQFLDAKPLQTRQLPVYSDEIAQKMAKIHNLEMPVDKSGQHLIKTMAIFEEKSGKIIEMAASQNTEAGNSATNNKTLLTTTESNVCSRFELYEKFKSFKELAIKKILEPSTSKIAFCHNDMQELNIMKMNQPTADEQLCFIDYEYAAYNFIAFDIANHFCEHMYDYVTTKKEGFEFNECNYPNLNQRRKFLNSYYQKEKSRSTLTDNQRNLNSEANSNGSGNDQTSNSTTDHKISTVNDQEIQLEIEKLLIDIEKFTLISDIFWVGWCLIQPFSEDFDVLEYGRVRLGQFEKRFKEFF